MKIEKKNKIVIKFININESRLPLVIRDSVGDRSFGKILKVIKSYDHLNHKIIGAFVDNILIGILGFYQTTGLIIIRHLSVLRNFQKQGIGTLLINQIKKCYLNYCIKVETDEEAVNFYIKSGFSCDEFKRNYDNLRYSCKFS